MMSFSAAMSCLKYQGYSFSVIQYCFRRYRTYTQTNHLVKHQSPCLHIANRHHSKLNRKINLQCDHSRVLFHLSSKCFERNESDVRNEKEEIEQKNNEHEDVASTDDSELMPDESYGVIAGTKEASPLLKQFCIDKQIPYEVHGRFCAPTALNHLCSKTLQTGMSVYENQEHISILDELQGLAKEEINSVDEYLVKDLLLSIFNVTHVNGQLVRAVYKRFNLWTNCYKYTVDELIDISAELSSPSYKYTYIQTMQSKAVIDHIWNHIALRSKQKLFSPDVFARIYAEGPVFHPIFTTMVNALPSLLQPSNIQSAIDVLKVPTKSKKQQEEKVAAISEWVGSNLTSLTHDDIQKLLSEYLKLDNVCPVMLENLEKIVDLLESESTKTVEALCQVVSYYTKGSYLNEQLLETACNHYINNTADYTSGDLHTLLQALGTLNFTPTSSRIFFTKVEDFLMENFYNIEISMLLEMFVSLIYIDRVPVNFGQLIFAPIFLGLVNDFKDERKTRAVQNIKLIEMALRVKGFKPALIFPGDVYRHEVANTEKSTRMITLCLHSIFRDSALVTYKKRPTFIGDSIIELPCVDIAKWANVQMPKISNKLVILPVSEDSFCTNNKQHMLGFEAANIRLLTAMGKIVAVMNTTKLFAYPRRQLADFLTSFLKEHIEEIAERATHGYIVDKKDIMQGDVPDDGVLGYTPPDYPSVAVVNSDDVNSDDDKSDDAEIL